MLLSRWMALAIGLLGRVALADDDDDVTISAEPDAPAWVQENSMTMRLVRDNGEQSEQFTVVPLTQMLAANESSVARMAINITGNMVAVDASNYNQIDKADVAYLSCNADAQSNDFVDPARMLARLMQIKPKAVVLYSTSSNYWCSLSRSDSLPYNSILSTANPDEPPQVLKFLNSTQAGRRAVRASINGNGSADDSNKDTDHGSRRENPAVAMSILYSITGIITLLFLVIIATGAIRAHRYPERYGPRRALPGHPRQSRAKGLALAVLDTIPIVKFGNNSPPKPDPELELESANNERRDVAAQPNAANPTEDQSRDAAAVSRTSTDRDGTPTTESKTPGAAVSGPPKGADTEEEEEHLGCSICTEDFSMGEDVRVLPCQHQFHPACIDPWLVNVSGTCPLCRHNLQPSKPGDAAGENTASGADTTLPPPLAVGGDENDDEANGSPRNQASRLIDTNRLREASREEQMAALRQMRQADISGAEAEAGQPGADSDARGRLTARLKEKFRIRTRAQTANDSPGASG